MSAIPDVSGITPNIPQGQSLGASAFEGRGSGAGGPSLSSRLPHQLSGNNRYLGYGLVATASAAALYWAFRFEFSKYLDLCWKIISLWKITILRKKKDKHAYMVME